MVVNSNDRVLGYFSEDAGLISAYCGEEDRETKIGCKLPSTSLMNFI